MNHEQECLNRDLDFWMERLEAVTAKQRLINDQIEAELSFVNKTIDTINDRLEALYWEQMK